MKAYLQRMGRSLQLPVAVLPAAALLVGIGNWWASYSNDIVAHFLQAGGNAVLGQLPLLFAVGLALGCQWTNQVLLPWQVWSHLKFQ